MRDRVRDIAAALRSPFFEARLNAALASLAEKPKTLDDAREVVVSVLRDEFGCDTQDVVLKLTLERGTDKAGEPFERLRVVGAHPSAALVMPVVERFKAEGRVA